MPLLSLTRCVDHEVKDGELRVRGHCGQVQLDGLALPDVFLHLSSVVYLQEGPDAPHDGEHIQTLVVVFGDGSSIFLVFGRDQALHQVTGLCTR